MNENACIQESTKSVADLLQKLESVQKRVAELEAREAHRKWEESAVYRIV